MGHFDQKVNKAIRELANIINDEIPIGRIIDLIDKGDIDKTDIYRMLETYGYMWSENNWQRLQPQWLQNAIQKFERDLEGDGFHERFIWIQTPLFENDETVHVFHDYLVKMELFIEGEIQNRSSNIRSVNEKEPTTIEIFEEPLTPYKRHKIQEIEALEFSLLERE